jgi:hypothetical protein
MKYYILVLTIIVGIKVHAQNLANPLYPNDATPDGLDELISDWGPRNLNGASGSWFHAGLDYSLHNNGAA